MRILAGDVGGTKTVVAVFESEAGKLVPVFQKKFDSRNYPGLEPIISEFLAGNPGPANRACFGVAGPVVGGRSETPNLPWVLDERALASQLAIDVVSLINDLEATAYGLFTLDEKEVFVLHEGAKVAEANIGLIAAGTGLGESILFWDGRYHRVSASEGGHGDFAARTEREIDLLRYLTPRFNHVSYERVLSGPGLVNIYQFLKDEAGFSEPQWLAERIATEDPGAVISEAALAGETEICVQALDLFVSVYGAEAGNLALRAKALGGIYVGGGIAPKILKKLEDGTFLRAFLDKGRYSEFVSTIPVKVILNEQAALQGAAYYAAHDYLWPSTR
jgi:glucokinase